MCRVNYSDSRRTRRSKRRREWTEPFEDIDEAFGESERDEFSTEDVKAAAMPAEQLTKRSWMWVLSRPSVWINLALAGFFFLERGPFFLVVMFTIFGVVRIMSLLSTPGVEERVRLREEKRSLGLGNHKLAESERREILRIDEYRKHLVRAGGDPALADQVVAGAWELVRNRRGGPGTASAVLKKYRQELPAIDVEMGAEPVEEKEQSLKDKLEAELQILRATHRELNV